MNKNKTFLKYFNFSISTQTISSKEKKESKKNRWELFPFFPDDPSIIVRLFCQALHRRSEGVGTKLVNYTYFPDH